MKKAGFKCCILFIFLSILVLPAISQNVQIDKRLEKGYDIEYLNRLRGGSGVTLEIMNFELDNAWYIADELVEKIDGFEYLYYKDPSTGEKSGIRVEKIDVNNLNIAEFYYERGLSNRTFYRIGDSNTILGFYSHKEVADMFNKAKGRNHE